MENCIFCKIIEGEVPAQVVYENEHVIAFNDINPVAPVHILVVPRLHIPSLNDLEPEHLEVMGHLILAVKEIARQHEIADKGYRLISNCGPDAGQVVYHIHFHLLGGRQFGHNLVRKS